MTADEESLCRLRLAVAALGGCALLLPADVAEVRNEERLVDPAVEYRDTHLHALGDHVSPLHLQLVGELGGRQVNSHYNSSLSLVQMYIASAGHVNRFRRKLHDHRPR